MVQNLRHHTVSSRTLINHTHLVPHAPSPGDLVQCPPLRLNPHLLTHIRNRPPSPNAQHDVVHAGGRGNLQHLHQHALNPHTANTRPGPPCSTTWYTLAAVETTSGVSRGERVLQIGVGSGIKCGVNVWKVG